MAFWKSTFKSVKIKPRKDGKPSGASYDLSSGTIKHPRKGSGAKIKVKGRSEWGR